LTAVEVRHTVAGPADAPVLVLSNSIGSSLAAWEQQEPLAAEVRVVRYDQRGHGRSPVPPGPYTLADLGADVVALLDRLEVSRASFCGLSLGGMVGMWLAAYAPDRIDRLLLCCTSVEPGTPQAWHDRAATVRADGMGPLADAVLGRWFTPGFREREPGTAAQMRAMFEATPPEGYAGCCEAIATMDLEPALPRIAAPTLVVAGAQDPATPPPHAERIAAGIPGARVEVVDDAAHLAPVEQPAALNALIRAHLSVTPPSEGSSP
jgi:3-oxoadipate enol-lactonase